jgi:transcriptional regulator with XRE-family HTH domain
MRFLITELKKDLIIKRCIQNDMSMDEAAKEMGVSKSTISRIEKSKLPDIETFGKVCKWLGEKTDKYFSND